MPKLFHIHSFFLSARPVLATYSFKWQHPHWCHHRFRVIAHSVWFALQKGKRSRVANAFDSKNSHAWERHLRAVALLVAAVSTTGQIQAASTPEIPDSVYATTDISAPISDDGAKLVIPIVHVLNGNVDEGVVRDTLTGKLAGAAKSLSKIDAERILIPLVLSKRRSEQTPVLVIREIAFNDVVDGEAATVSIGEIEFSTGVKITDIKAEAFSILRILEMNGLLGAAEGRALAPFFESLSIGGGTVFNPEASCTFQPLEMGSLAVRLPSPAYTRLMQKIMGSEYQKAEGQDQLPVQSWLLARTAAENEMGAFHFDGLICNTGTDGAYITRVGQITFGGNSGARTSDLSIQRLSVMTKDGHLNLDRLALGPIDFSHVAAAAATQGDGLTFDWLSEHSRELVPSFSDFTLRGFRFAGKGEPPFSIPDITLRIGNSRNGIPTEASLVLDHGHHDLNALGESYATLVELGYTFLDYKADLNARWDEQAQTIIVEHATANVVDMGDLELTLVLGNAGPELFSVDPHTAERALSALTLKFLSFSLSDKSLLGRLMKHGAETVDMDLDAFRNGGLNNLLGALTSLGDKANTPSVSQSLTRFITGASPKLALTISANDPAGASLNKLSAGLRDLSFEADALGITTGFTATPPLETETGVSAVDGALSNREVQTVKVLKDGTIVSSGASPFTARSEQSSTYFVQLSSQRSEAAAEEALVVIDQRFSQLFDGRSAFVRRVDQGDLGVFFRVLVPADTLAAANAVCTKIKQADGDCFVRSN